MHKQEDVSVLSSWQSELLHMLFLAHVKGIRNDQQFKKNTDKKGKNPKFFMQEIIMHSSNSVHVSMGNK
jgi:hypothetical protein